MLNRPSPDHKIEDAEFMPNEVYAIDIVVSTGGRAVANAPTSPAARGVWGAPGGWRGTRGEAQKTPPPFVPTLRPLPLPRRKKNIAGEGKPKVVDEKETTVYKRAVGMDYQLKLKASR